MKWGVMRCHDGVCNHVCTCIYIYIYIEYYLWIYVIYLYTYVSTPTCLFEINFDGFRISTKNPNPKTHGVVLDHPPEAMGFDLDLEVLPSTMDVWAIEEKAPQSMGRWGKWGKWWFWKNQFLFLWVLKRNVVFLPTTSRLSHVSFCCNFCLGHWTQRMLVLLGNRRGCKSFKCSSIGNLHRWLSVFPGNSSHSKVASSVCELRLVWI